MMIHVTPRMCIPLSGTHRSPKAKPITANESRPAVAR